MPIEFEYKYVISFDILKEIDNLNFIETRKIKQGYLKDSIDNTIRIRSIEDVDKKTHEWVFTFKQRIPNTLKIIEIEQHLDKSDADALWKMCDRKLKKTRKCFLDEKNILWELDLFYSNKEIYFIQAEVELKINSKQPKVPNFLKKHILYKVPLTDERFSNKKLSNVSYAKKLYKKIKNGV